MTVGLHVIARIPGGYTLVPGQRFSARNRITGHIHHYRYRGSIGENARGEMWLNCVDRRGNCRSIAVDAVESVHPHRSKAGD